MAGGLFGIGGWSSIARSAYRSLRDTVLGGARTDPSASPQLTATRGAVAAPESLRIAGESLRTAFDKLSTKTRPVYTTTLYSGQSSSAMLNGTSARVERVEGYSILETTARVNTRVSTVRSSSSALGLDVVSAEASSVLRSSAGLGLDVVSAQSASTIQSTAEMNTGVTTSYGSPSLTFHNNPNTTTSSSTGTLTGTYTGTGLAANATQLIVEITNGDTIGFLGIGQGDIDFRVKDQAGTVLFTYSGQLGTNEQVYLGDDIGLTLSFSAGELKNNHTAETTVTKTPITVSGTAAFNASAVLRPQFEGGAVVSAGTFTVNGATITVAANDTINGVITKINSSAAGVTASLANDRITLTSNSYSEDAIVLANDTTGFLAATKLAAATTTVGNIRDDQQTLAKTSQFGSVATGSFTINGVSISVDKDTDSLETLITRINSAGAGVTAAFNAATNKVELTTSSISEDLITVAGDSSGFLAAAGLSTNNTVRGNIQDDDQVFAKTSQFNDVVNGSFVVNGVSIAVNKDTDSLTSLISRVNSSGAGVTASYDAGTDRLVFTPDVAGATLTIGSDTSGFLAEAHIAAGTEATQVNPDAAFNATGASAPQFDSGLSVQAGSFTVNGVNIAVAADDSINDVLASITASAAGVDASYDAATQTVTLTSQDFGADPIVVGNDTSGFLAAVKLDGTANSTTGGDASAFELAIGEMDEYDGVQAGTLTVNGQAIAIDPANTTVQGLIAALNQVTNVTASVDEQTGAITINSSLGGAVAVSDTSGILTAIGLTAGTFSGTVGETTGLRTQTGTVPADSPAVVVEIAKAVADVNTVLGEMLAGQGEDAALTGDVKDGMQALVDALERAGVQGVSVGSEAGAPVLSVDREALERALNAVTRPTETRAAAGSAVDTFVAAIAGAATTARAEAPAAQSLRRSMTIELTSLPPLDRSGQSRASGARASAKTSAYRKQAIDPAEPRTFEPAASTTSSTTARAAWAEPVKQPGLFEGLLDDWV